MWKEETHRYTAIKYYNVDCTRSTDEKRPKFWKKIWFCFALFFNVLGSQDLIVWITIDIL